MAKRNGMSSRTLKGFLYIEAVEETIDRKTAQAVFMMKKVSEIVGEEVVEEIEVRVSSTVIRRTRTRKE